MKLRCTISESANKNSLTNYDRRHHPLSWMVFRIKHNIYRHHTGSCMCYREWMATPAGACVIICKVEAGTTSMILHGTILQGGRKVFLIYRRNCHGQSWKKTVGADVKGCFPKSVPSMWRKHPAARVKDCYLYYALLDAVKEILNIKENSNDERWVVQTTVWKTW